MFFNLLNSEPVVFKQTKSIESDMEKLIHVAYDQIESEGMLKIPDHAKGMVLFAHGSGTAAFLIKILWLMS